MGNERFERQPFLVGEDSRQAYESLDVPDTQQQREFFQDLKSTLRQYRGDRE